MEDELVEAKNKLEEAKGYEKGQPLEEIDKEISAKNKDLEKVKEKGRNNHEKEKPLEGTDKENGANNEHLDSEKHESEDLQKAILVEIEKLKEKKKDTAEKKWVFERSQNKVQKIEKIIDWIKETEKKEGLADKDPEVINKLMDEEINEKRKILNEMILIDLKLDKMKKEICGKCLGLPVALIEAAKGLAFEEYK